MKLTVLNKRVVCVLVSLVGLATITSAGAQNRLSIATGPTSGVYFPLGGAVAKVLTSNLPDTTATHAATSASADNIRMIVAGKADIAFTQADTAWDGYKGYGKFPQPQPIRAIAVLYANSLHLVTLRSAGITKVSDLRGKRVSTGPKGSGTEIWGVRLLQASGLDPDKDIVRSSIGPAESATALKENKLDAFIWSSGVPVKAVTELAKDPAVKLQLLNTANAVPTMLRKYGPVYADGEIPIYSAGQIPAASYAGITAPVKVAQVWNILIVRADMDNKLVYNMVKALFEHKTDLIAGHSDAANIQLANQGRGGSPIPFHPGAKKYYAEQGIRILR